MVLFSHLLLHFPSVQCLLLDPPVSSSSAEVVPNNPSKFEALCVTFRNMLFSFAVRSCYLSAQPPRWRTIPFRLLETASSICSQLPSIFGGRFHHPQPKDTQYGLPVYFLVVFSILADFAFRNLISSLNKIDKHRSRHMECVFFVLQLGFVQNMRDSVYISGYSWRRRCPDMEGAADKGWLSSLGVVRWSHFSA
jgi:hypothetical protein